MPTHLRRIDDHWKKWVACGERKDCYIMSAYRQIVMIVLSETVRNAISRTRTRGSVGIGIVEFDYVRQ